MRPSISASQDDHPWEHPFLTPANIGAFRSFSEGIWSIAMEHGPCPPTKLDCAFSVNLAQSMYKWARLAEAYGARPALYCHPQDVSAISRPEWEDFDGEYPDILDGAGFLESNPQLHPTIPCQTIPMGDSGLLQAWEDSRDRGDWQGLHGLLAGVSMFPEAAFAHPGYYPYWDWARALQKHEVICTCSLPIAAYLSGRPYCFLSVGGDMQIDSGQANAHGMIMRLALNRARFILVTNPHTLGHCRRLGLRNAVYLPYPMDSNRYCPGEGRARADWEAAYGPGVYVLTTSRMDRAVKGHDQDFVSALLSVARDRQQARFLFLGWGHDIEAFRERVIGEGLQRQIVILPPVGKKRLIDYYRSCDVVLDQFVYGYFGATALEAASIGKPVVMKTRDEQYTPLYAGDLAPVENVKTAEEMRASLLGLIDRPDYRSRQGQGMREWLVRNHGEEKTTPLLLALLGLARDFAGTDHGLVNPLDLPLSESELAYHRSCLQPAE